MRRWPLNRTIPGLAEKPALGEILNHAYEYTVREDIVMAMEELELTDAQAQALLDSPSPLADVPLLLRSWRPATWMWSGTALSNRADAA